MKNLIAALLMLLVATPALAARSYDAYNNKKSSGKSSHVYVGVSGGQNKINDSSITNTSTGYSVFVGYAFNPYVATELAYTNFGKLEVGSGVDLNSSAGSLSLLGSLPMGKYVSLFGKVGYASATTELVTASVTAASENQTGAVVGAGLMFNLGERVGIRLGYDRYKIMLSTLTYDSNFSHLGLLFKF